MLLIYIFPTIAYFTYSCLSAEFDDDDFASIMAKQSCITEQTQYFFENDNPSFSGYLDCVNCTR